MSLFILNTCFISLNHKRDFFTNEKLMQPNIFGLIRENCNNAVCIGEQMSTP